MSLMQSLTNPFPGLRHFRSDEHHLFFGREDQTAALVQLLRENRFLAVVGTSGSGKSSLVRAGMIAELHGGTMTRAGSTWEVMILPFHLTIACWRSVLAGRETFRSSSYGTSTAASGWR
jgi:energy-coupling factor transporter ATP-binding protein EcfA2